MDSKYPKINKKHLGNGGKHRRFFLLFILVQTIFTTKTPHNKKNTKTGGGGSQPTAPPLLKRCPRTHARVVSYTKAYHPNHPPLGRGTLRPR